MADYNTATDGQAQTVVVDADEYNKQQRFEEIHSARKRVVQHLSTYDEGNKSVSGTASSRTWDAQLSMYVSVYITELLPLLEKQNRADPYMSTEFDDDSRVEHLKQFSEKLGLLIRHEDTGERSPVRMRESMQVFQVANRAFAELGMELDVAEEQTDAAFSYDDILENSVGGETPDVVADGGDE